MYSLLHSFPILIIHSMKFTIQMWEGCIFPFTNIFTYFETYNLEMKNTPYILFAILEAEKKRKLVIMFSIRNYVFYLFMLKEICLVGLLHVEIALNFQIFQYEIHIIWNKYSIKIWTYLSFNHIAIFRIFTYANRNLRNLTAESRFWVILKKLPTL